MSIHQYIGPYAQFQRHPDKEGAFPPWDPEAEGTFLCGEALQPNGESGVGPGDSVCYVPSPWDERGRNGPARQMSLGDDPAVEDLTAVDREAEIAWFARAYKTELDILAERFRNPPLIRWGLVSFYIN